MKEHVELKMPATSGLKDPLVSWDNILKTNKNILMKFENRENKLEVPKS